MNTFARSISQIFKGAVRAFHTFPAAIACALAFTIVTMIRIQLDWPEQEAYNFMFNCLHWALASGAIFSLAATTSAQIRSHRGKTFLMANLFGAAAAVVIFLALYLFAAAGSVAGSRFEVISGIAASRVGVFMLVSFLIFILLAGSPKDQSDFARSFFMTHKAFFIALLYGLVLMGGSSAVAGAVQALLYRSMSGKVYQYLAAVTGFLAFTIFVGYFPDFRRGHVDEHREIAQKQPRFIEILFGFIMIPIVLALTVVLLIWAGKTVVAGSWPEFYRLSGIAAGYAFGGIWLHIMVTHYESGPAKFYCRIYPIAALVILAFEAWALLVQLGRSGLKQDEYFFILMWIFAVAAAVLLLIGKEKAHLRIIALTCALAVIAVLPAVGYQALPVTAQVSRLEKLLTSQGMLEGDILLPATIEPKLEVRESITDAVNFLAYAEDAKLPVWFDERLGEGDVFLEKLGFEQTWPQSQAIDNGGNGTYLSTSLMLPPGPVDIGEYRWAVDLQNSTAKEGTAAVTVDGDKGAYQIEWTTNAPYGIPTLKIQQNENVILEQDMSGYIDRTTAKFPPGEAKPSEVSLEDMSLRLEAPEVTVLLVFSDVQINIDAQQDTISYWLNLNSIYLRENP